MEGGCRFRCKSASPPLTIAVNRSLQTNPHIYTRLSPRRPLEAKDMHQQECARKFLRDIYELAWLDMLHRVANKQMIDFAVKSEGP